MDGRSLISPCHLVPWRPGDCKRLRATGEPEDWAQYPEKANVNAGAKKTLQKAGPFSGSYAPVKASGMIR
jgi:hypothetical protein